MPKRIVLIQDTIECSGIMRYILEDEGFEVVSYESKEILLSNINYDLVIIDEYASEKNGIEICKQLKNYTLTSNIPVMLTSTETGLDSLAGSSKADTYLFKPFDIHFFSSLVHKACNK